MKGTNVFLIVITSIITFIGLVCNKLYDKYIKNNLLVQMMLYAFWTLLAFRLLFWIAKPLIPTGVPRCLQHIDKINIVVPEVTPLVALIIFVVCLVGVVLFIKSLVDSVDEEEKR